LININVFTKFQQAKIENHCRNFKSIVVYDIDGFVEQHVQDRREEAKVGRCTIAFKSKPLRGGGGISGYYSIFFLYFWLNGPLFVTFFYNVCVNFSNFWLSNQCYWNILVLSVPVHSCLYTAISIKVVHEQSGKVEYERERLLETALKIH
jgi:hypothetical protein